MASSDDSFANSQADRRHPAYELHRSCERDTNVTNMTGDTIGSISDDKEDGDYVLTPDLADRLVKRTEMRVAQVVASSSYVQQHCTLYQLPRFDRNDFELGDLIALSEEYPEFAGSIYNDQVGVWINGSPVPLPAGSGEASVGNINQSGGINLFHSNTGDQFNTEMDGFTITLSLTMSMSAWA